MGVSEAIGRGLEVTVTGLVVVFSVLIILMLVLILMKVVFYKEPKEDKGSEALKDKSAPSAAVSAPQTAKPSESGAQIDDKELIAVITAAVAASLNTSTYNLKVKSFRRISDNSPLWNKAGRTDVINSRF